MVNINKSKIYHSLHIVDVSYEVKKAIGDCPDNVDFLGKMPQNELIENYKKAKDYAQLSVSEGLPNTLCEAMLCECIPVGTDVGDIKYAIGESGITVEDRTVESVKIALDQALQLDSSYGLKTRQRIASLFPEQGREKEICSLLSKC